MKPKTKIQKEVDALSKRLLPLSNEQKEYAEDKMFKKHLYKTRKEITCFECGHKWADSTPKDSLVIKLGGCTCPQCGKDLEFFHQSKRTITDVENFAIMTTVKNYQVFRYFRFEKFCKVSHWAEYKINEVVQHWIRDDGKLTVRTIKYNAFGYGESWSLGTPLEIRAVNDRLFIWAKILYPKKKVLPILRRNGYKNGFHRLHPTSFCQRILTKSKAETLLKSKQYSLFGDFNRYENQIEEHWGTIRICIRNGYIIKEASDWFDNIDLLKYFGKDILNKKYVCPTDLKADHQRLVAKKLKIDKLADREKMKAKIEKHNLAYLKTKGKYLNLSFSNGSLHVSVLKDVNEFMLEGEAMDHCVFTNGYYKEKDSLILSAKNGDERLETIELSLKDMEIVQCRGRFNENTKYHNDILNLVNSNLGSIKKIHKSKQKAEV